MSFEEEDASPEFAQSFGGDFGSNINDENDDLFSFGGAQQQPAAEEGGFDSDQTFSFRREREEKEQAAVEDEEQQPAGLESLDEEEPPAFGGEEEEKKEADGGDEGDEGDQEEEDEGPEKPVLKVPTLAAMQFRSNRADGKMPEPEPIIIWWFEAAPPTYTKRKMYFSFVQPEIVLRVESNIARAFRAVKRESNKTIFPTNTARYIYPIPKVEVTRVGDVDADFDRKKKMSRHLLQFAERNSQIPVAGYMSALAPLRADSADTKVSKYKRDMYLYRDIVVTSCGESKNGKCQIKYNCDQEPQDDARQKSVRCSSAADYKNLVSDNGLSLKHYLPYVAENTLANFQSFPDTRRLGLDDFRRFTVKRLQTL